MKKNYFLILLSSIFLFTFITGYFSSQSTATQQTKTVGLITIS
jgi:hypothetical protein